MRFKQINPQKCKRKYRPYSPTSLINAYQKVIEEKKSVTGTAKQYNVPITTLRDRVLGNVDPETVKSGRNPVLTSFQESTLVEHLKVMSDYGYGYSRQEVVDIATDYAVQLGLREKSHPFSIKWFRGFVSRWPELKVMKARSLEISRAKCASTSAVNNYFQELETVMAKYGFDKNPQLIYNIDEKGFSLCHSPPSVVCSSQHPPQAVTAGKSSTTTVIGCGSATGVSLPPYFIFSGKKMMDELMEGATPGAVGKVSDSGWSNSQLFRDYLKDHFLKHVPIRSGQNVLLIMDGHKTHGTIGLVEWAKSQNIILFILPAHTSHVLQPLDVGCYGPMQRMYNSECHKFTRESHCTVTRYNICQLVCKVYHKALSADNLISAFKRTGIYPLNRNAIPPESLKPAEAFSSAVTVQESCEVEKEDHIEISGEQQCQRSEERSDVETETDVELEIHSTSEAEGKENVNPSSQINLCQESSFFKQKEANLISVKSKQMKKERKTMGKIISGRCITEENVLELMNKHVQDQCKNKKSATVGKNGKKSGSKSKVTRNSQVPSGSGEKIKHARKETKQYFDSEDSEVDMEVSEAELCCVCKAFTPKEVRESYQFIIVNWAQCDGVKDGIPCKHWTHLRFCCSKNVMRRHDKFLCPHCDTME